MIKDFDIKRIVISYDEGVPEATAMVEFTMVSSKPSIDDLKAALTAWVQQLQGQKTLTMDDV